MEGNYIGTDATGTADLGNFSNGVFINGAPGNTIGGTASVARNVISGNANGVLIQGSGATANAVEGNYIGTDATGTANLGNLIYGVQINGAPGNTIGGTASGARNVLSGNGSSGVLIENSGATANAVEGNYIGTDATGTADLGNFSYGVFVVNASSNTIGGTASGARNIISGNDLYGVFLGSGATSNAVEGNYIGTDATGTADLGNFRNGVFIENASSNTIGGTASGARNVISYNDSHGVEIRGAGTTGNTVTGNSIHDNAGLGINNSDGGNTELTPPTVTAAGSASGSSDCASCTIEVFSDAADEGKTFHGSTMTASGACPCSWSFAGAVTGPNITATVTDISGNTSEFSVPFVADSCPPMPWPTPAGDDDCDGTTSADETLIGTDPDDPCGANAWPPDFDDNMVINTTDVFQVLPPNFGQAVTTHLVRQNLNPADAVINTTDVFRVLPPFLGSSCVP